MSRRAGCSPWGERTRGGGLGLVDGGGALPGAFVGDDAPDVDGDDAVGARGFGGIIHMSIDGEYAGHIVISDVIKPHSKEAIQKLKHAGVEKTVMLTGDAKRVADQVAKELGIDEVRSSLPLHLW